MGVVNTLPLRRIPKISLTRRRPFLYLPSFMLRPPLCPRKSPDSEHLATPRLLLRSSLDSTTSPASVMGFPVYSRQQVPTSVTPNVFVANVPGIWAIQVGKPSAGQIGVEFVVDRDTASSVRRWAAKKREFE
jgi:hypothetical protein